MMKLIALYGTAYEDTVKDLFHHQTVRENQAKDIVEKHTGYRPDSFMTECDYGDTGYISPMGIRFREEDEDKLDKVILKRKSNNDARYFEPNMKSIAGKDLKKELIEKVSGKWLRGCVLESFGIRTLVEDGLFFPWSPQKDDSGHYYIEISDAAEKYLDGAITKKYLIVSKK